MKKKLKTIGLILVCILFLYSLTVLTNGKTFGLCIVMGVELVLSFTLVSSFKCEVEALQVIMNQLVLGSIFMLVIPDVMWTYTVETSILYATAVCVVTAFELAGKYPTAVFIEKAMDGDALHQAGAFKFYKQCLFLVNVCVLAVYAALISACAIWLKFGVSFTRIESMKFISPGLIFHVQCGILGCMLATFVMSLGNYFLIRKTIKPIKEGLQEVCEASSEDEFYEDAAETMSEDEFYEENTLGESEESEDEDDEEDCATEVE